MTSTFITKKYTHFMSNTKTVNYNVNDSMTGLAALWNTSAVDAVTVSSVSAFHSGIQRIVRRMTAGRACMWLVGFVVCVCVGVWCAQLLW